MADAMRVILTFDDVSLEIDGRRLLDSVRVEIGAAERTAILGFNGAGKSVFLRLCHGLLRPSSGRVRWHSRNGQPVRQAMVFQRPVMLRRSALGNLTHALALAGVARSERRAKAHAALVRVGLEGAAERPARVLSGGEQQRLALARAWALEPEVLLLDEPTANLDPAATREVEAIVSAIHASGTKIVMTTHNLGQARRLSDEVLFLAHGRLVERTATDAFFRHPASAPAQAFVKGELP